MKNNTIFCIKDTYNFPIIIPCYNLGSLLSKVIDSIFVQTLDDTSPDKETQKISRSLFMLYD